MEFVDTGLQAVGSWPPVILALAIVAHAFTSYLKFLSQKRQGAVELPQEHLQALASALTALQVSSELQSQAMLKLVEETHDLWTWHNTDDPATGQKRWFSDPAMRKQLAEIHRWTLERRQQQPRGNEPSPG